MGKAQMEELKSQCAANSPWDPATGSDANGIEVVVMASAMSDLFTVSFVAASLVLRIFRSGSCAGDRCARPSRVAYEGIPAIRLPRRAVVCGCSREPVRGSVVHAPMFMTPAPAL